MGEHADSRRDDVARRRRLQVHRRGPHLDARRASTGRGTSRSIRIHPTDPDTRATSPRRARPTARPRTAASIARPTAARPGRSCSSSTRPPGPSDLAMDPTNPRILYAAMWDHLRQPWEVRSGGPGSGIHKSTDGGATWQRVDDRHARARWARSASTCRPIPTASTPSSRPIRRAGSTGRTTARRRGS